MQSDREVRIRFRQLDGVTGRALVDHQAAACQHTFAMGLDDRAVDRFGIAEIVAVDNQWDPLAYEDVVGIHSFDNSRANFFDFALVGFGALSKRNLRLRILPHTTNLGGGLVSLAALTLLTPSRLA